MRKGEELWQDIEAKLPILAEIMRENGSQTVYDYAQGYFKYAGKENQKNKKQEEFLEVLGEIIEERLGKSVADSAVRQLRKCLVISTAEHHSPLAHPFFLNSNLISSMPLFESADADMENLIVLSFSSPSLSNDSGYSRGIVWSEDGNEKKKINIFTEKEKNIPIYAARAFTAADLERAGAEADSRMRGIVQKYFAPHLSAANLCEQITKINFNLWSDIVRSEKKVNLIYIEIESVVRELLLRCIDEETVRKLIVLSDTPFWETRDRHRKKFSSVDIEEIQAKLHTREIFPAMSTCYAMVAFYYGFTCLGGFCQVNDLTALKEIWEKNFSATDTDTKAYGGDGLELIPHYGLDLVGNPIEMSQVIEKAKNTTLRQAMQPMLPEIRKVIY